MFLKPRIDLQASAIFREYLFQFFPLSLAHCEIVMLHDEFNADRFFS